MLIDLADRYFDIISKRALILSELLISDTVTYLIAGAPVMILLLILIGVFIKLLIKDPKGSLGALFGVLGVIAVLVIPALFWDGEKWAAVIQLAILAPIVLYTLKSNPRRFFKILLITLACIAGLVIIAFAFGFDVAVAVAFNGFMLMLTLWESTSLREYLRLEREGISTEGRFVRWESHGRNLSAIFSYTTEDGRTFEEPVCEFVTVSQKMKTQTFTLLYDKADPTIVYVKKHSLIGSIIGFGIFLALFAGSLGFTIYLFVLVNN